MKLKLAIRNNGIADAVIIDRIKKQIPDQP
jgi:hypothetical protein